MAFRKLTFVTGNRNKLAEVEAILGGIVPLRNEPLDLNEIQGSTAEISKDKCRRAAAVVGLDIFETHPSLVTDLGEVRGPVLTEDTGLSFNALKGLPGPYIKWFLQALGHEGLNNLLAPYEDKSAQAVCTFAYCDGPGHEPLLFEGRVSGKIVSARGPTDFGWDPIFEYEGETYAEMTRTKKNSLSHRALALSKLRQWLEQTRS